MANCDITLERLQELLHYDPESGVFTSKRWRGGSARANRPAGTIMKRSGYVRIQIDGRLYMGHRLAWLYMTGKHPSQQIDHIDGNRQNNRFSNLREVSQTLNSQNQRKAKSHNKTGYLGVSIAYKKYHAQIKVHGTPVHLGYFTSAEAAHEAYLAAKRKYHEACAI
jgi:hypothetical protein